MAKESGWAPTVLKLAGVGAGLFLAVDPITLPIGAAILAGVLGVQVFGGSKESK